MFLIISKPKAKLELCLPLTLTLENNNAICSLRDRIYNKIEYKNGE